MNNLTGLRLENVHAIDLHSEPSVLFVEDRGLAKDDKEVSFAVVFQILSRRCHAKPNLARAKIGSPNSGSGRGGGSPRLESVFSEEAERAAGCEMTLDIEGVVNGGVNRQESLG
jgi:hypothetical protein